jgi:hypothetical protein
MSWHQDLLNMTRDMHEGSLEVEYMKKTPVLNLILEKGNRKFKGGKQYYFETDTGDVEELTQDYSGTEPLTHAAKDTTDRVSFRRKTFQHPIMIDMDEDLENGSNAESGTQLHDLAKHKVKKAQEAVRLHLRKLFYAGTNGTTAPSFLGTDTNKYVQGLNGALQLDAANLATYGGITRYDTLAAANTAGKGWWQPACNLWDKATGGSGASYQECATSISIDALQGWADPLGDMETSAMDLAVILGPALYLALKSEAQARQMPVTYDPAGNFKYGIQEMVIDNMRIIRDPFLSTAYNTFMGVTAAAIGALERRVYILNMNDIHFNVHPKRNFALTEFFDQSKIAGAADFELARIKFAGNLCFWHPNQSLYMSNVTT